MEGALTLNINTKRPSTITSAFDLAGIASPFSSPWPNRPNRPITILHGSEVIWMRPMHHSHSFCSPIFLAETLGRRALQLTEKKMIKRAEKEPRMTTRLKSRPNLLGTSMLIMLVSRSSPCWSVQDTRSHRWSCDRQYPTKSTLYLEGSSAQISPCSGCLGRVGPRMKGGE